jgi:hypothetical protein
MRKCPAGHQRNRMPSTTRAVPALDAENESAVRRERYWAGLALSPDGALERLVQDVKASRQTTTKTTREPIRGFRMALAPHTLPHTAQRARAFWTHCTVRPKSIPLPSVPASSTSHLELLSSNVENLGSSNPVAIRGHGAFGRVLNSGRRDTVRTFSDRHQGTDVAVIHP